MSEGNRILRASLAVRGPPGVKDNNRVPTPLVLCADDFGLSPGIDAAILALVDAGRLTATTVMAAGPDLEAAAPALLERAGRAEIGLHFTLTDLPPLGSMPRLAPAGRPPALGALIRTAVAGGLDGEEIAAELGRQLDRFEAIFGRPPDFLDGHQHVHVLPGVRGAVFGAFASGRLDRRRVWLRHSAPPVAAWRIAGWPRRKALVVTALAAGLSRAAARHGVSTNDGFLGYTDFRADGSFGAVFAAQLAAARGERTLAMCHPSAATGDTPFADPIAGARRDEYAYLASERFAVDLRRHGVVLARPSWR
jgi:predicted glycoside hydrolase/deacetylase ChbG (UPF0249 family)